MKADGRALAQAFNVRLFLATDAISRHSHDSIIHPTGSKGCGNLPAATVAN